MNNADANAAWSIVGLLISGLVVWGGVGALLTHLTGLRFFLPVGILLGVVASLYLVVARYGRA